jgi:hypothetical protein
MAQTRSPALPARRTALTIIARIGFGARGLVYLLVAAFATAAALDLWRTATIKKSSHRYRLFTMSQETKSVLSDAASACDRPE